jgi:hypothetical protein
MNNIGFKPDYNPIQMFELGIFGGAYFKEKKDVKNWQVSVDKKFIKDLNKSSCIRNDIDGVFHKQKNKYKVDCGSTYDQWCDKDWINHELDPYGWVNWYINYYYGRRVSSEDEKQIKRWKQFKARHLGMLKSRGEKYKLPENNLKTKQNLLHWAINWQLH